MRKTARPGSGAGGGNGTVGSINGPDSTCNAASRQDELAVAERVAKAEREAVRSAIVAYCNAISGGRFAAELERLYKTADRQLADARRAIRERGRRRP